MPVNRRNSADHSLHHLIAELAFAPRVVHAPASLAKTPLHFPDGSTGDK